MALGRTGRALAFGQLGCGRPPAWPVGGPAGGLAGHGGNDGVSGQSADVVERHLALARRLAATPELVPVAAQQYLPVIEAITDAAERSHVLALLRRAAEQASISEPVSRASATRSAPVQTGRTRRTESVERQQLSDPLGYGETTSSTI